MLITQITSALTMWISLGVVIVAIGLYMNERISMELVSIGIVTGLLTLFAMPFAVGANGEPVQPDLLLNGFGNAALVTIMALLVIGHGMFQTGALDGPSRRLLQSYAVAPRLTMVAAYAAVYITSAFVNNTPVVVMFLPIMSAIAARTGMAPSKLLIPLSFVSVFGGMTTLIGSSTNLLAAETLLRLEGRELGFFELAPIGLALSAIGVAYIVILGPILLPNREAEGESSNKGTGKQFIAQIEVTHDHPMEGKQSVAGMFPDLPNMTVRMVQRGHEAILPPFEDLTLRPGDLIIVAATRTSLTEVLSRRPKLLRSIWRTGADSYDEASGNPPQLSLSEAVVAPGSRLISRTIDQMGYANRNDAVVLGVQRRSRMIRARLGEIRLESGDTLLLCGTRHAFDDMRTDRDLLLLDWSRTDLPDVTKAIYARLIALGVVLTAATGMLNILHAAMIGAVMMIVTGCLNVRQASRALDLRIFLLIGAALAMGASLEATGAADFVAQNAVAIAAPYGPLAILSVLFLTVALVTNLLSNSATAIIFTPIAIATARQLNLDPTPFVLTVIYASNCAFATPIAYQTNLLVMGPGHYRFADYVKFGTPLVLLIWVAFTAIAGWQFNLVGA
ncbi:SLC13 family permease [Hirschia litorea]|uniref:SLC13 family permease n=1 Tax=Hirschia litorea TaxID=1199156 RepID=A0ABW2II64_9PROT